MMIAINSIARAKVGLFGFTIRLDLTALLIYKLKAVQVGKYPTIADPQVLGDFPKPVTSEVTMDVLNSYLNDPNAPRLAFNYSYGEATLFCKNAAGVSDHAVSTRYRIGDYVNHAIGATAVEGIWKCVSEGVSDAAPSTSWAVTGFTETSGAKWEFIDYLPITDTIDYAANTFFELFGYRNTQACSSDTDRIDVPDKDIGLMINYALATVWNINKQHIPIKIQNIIDNEELRIINE